MKQSPGSGRLSAKRCGEETKTDRNDQGQSGQAANPSVSAFADHRRAHPKDPRTLRHVWPLSKSSRSRWPTLPRVLTEAERILADQDAVDVVHALHDLEELRVAEEPPDHVLLRRTVCAVDLDGVRGGAERHLRGVELRDGR